MSEWISVEIAKPDSGRILVYTPNPNKEMEYRVVDGSLFKQVCSEATHWKPLSPPK